MKKYKNFLFYLIAFNSLVFSNSLFENTELDKEASYRKNNKNINRLLNKKIKELKDLEQQGDYIVKPEYLEWQIFFSGFYNEKSRAKNKKEIITKDETKSKKIPLPVFVNRNLKNKIIFVPDSHFLEEKLFLLPEINIVEVSADIFLIENIPTIQLPTFNTPISFSVTPPVTANEDETYTALEITDTGLLRRGRTALLSQYNLTSGVVKAYYDGNGYNGYADSGGLTFFEVINLNGTPDIITGSGADYGKQTILNDLTISGSPGDSSVVSADRITSFFKMIAAEKIELGVLGDTASLRMEIISDLPLGSVSSSIPHLIQYDPHANSSRTNYSSFSKDHYGNPILSPVPRDRYGELINYGTLTGKGNSFLLLGMQGHNGSVNAVYRNSGLMLGYYDENAVNKGEYHIAHAFIASGANYLDRRFEFHNEADGIVELQANKSIAYYYGDVNTLTNKPHYNIYNEGRIVLYGSENVGIKTGNATQELEYSKIILNAPIIINGDESIGVEIAKFMDDGYNSPDNSANAINGYDSQTAVIKVLIGDEENKYSGDTTGKPGFVENSIGLYINKNGLFYRLKNFDFSFGKYAKSSFLSRIDNGHLFLDNIDISDINIVYGKENIAFSVSGNSSEFTLRPNLTIGNSIDKVDGTIAVYVDNNGKIHLDSNNSINTNGLGSHAIVLKNNASLDSAGYNHSLNTYGNESSVIYVENSSLDLSSSNIVNIGAFGSKSIGVFNDGGAINIGLAAGSGNYEIGENGILFYNKSDTGKIYTAGNNFTVGNLSLFAYIGNPSSSSGNEQIYFTNNSNINLKFLSGANGFVYIANGFSLSISDINNYFTNNFFGLNKVDVILDSGSSLLTLAKYGTLPLSSIASFGFGAIFKSITGTGAQVSLLEGTFILDPVSNLIDLDDPNDLFNKTKIFLTAVTVNPNVVIEGVSQNQTALKGDNSEEAVRYIKFNNNGIINLSGDTSVAMYTNNGEISNNGVINMTGSDSIALYAENDTQVENLNTINIKDKSIGIYGISYKNLSLLPSFGGGKIDIRNDGLIKAASGNGAFGIYADYNKGIRVPGESKINLSTGTIDVSSSTNGVGVYANESEITGGGNITVGQNGIGIFVKNSEISLSGLTVNLNGDNSLAFYIEGASSTLTGTGIINVNAKNTTLFDVKLANTFIDFSGITINSINPNSSYSLGNFQDSRIINNNTGQLDTNGIFVKAVNSNIIFDMNSLITNKAGAENLTAMAIDGQYTGTIVNFDGENRGGVSFGNKSIALLGKNGARLQNTGNIIVGNESIALKTQDLNSMAENVGNINIGSNSIGLFTSDALSINNLFGGEITASAATNNSIGLYSSGNQPTIITNKGSIILSGNNSMGIYSSSSNLSQILNSGNIIIGDTTDPSNSSVGIYSINGMVTLDSNSSIKTGNKSIGVYASDGASVKNDGIMETGNDGYAYVLKSNSNLTNNKAISLKEASIFVYGDGAGDVLNNESILMNASNGAGFYTINGGNIENNGSISGKSGEANVGIYNENGTINNTGKIELGNSIIRDKNNYLNNSYSVGIYGDNTKITNTGNIQIGYYGVGIYSNNSPNEVINSGNISSFSEGAIAVYAENSSLKNSGNIDLSGDNSIGIYANNKSQVINEGIITINGDNSAGIFLNSESVLDNQGTININGNNSTGILLRDKSQLINESGGIINISGSVTGSEAIEYIGKTGAVIINSGSIKISNKFQTENVNILIKVDPNTIEVPSLAKDKDYSYVTDAVKFIASEFIISKPVEILPGFSYESHGETYKLKDVFNISGSNLNNSDLENIKVKSKSLTWEAQRVINENGNADIIMKKIPYVNFMKNSWYEDFGRALDSKFIGSTGDRGKIFDKIDFLETEKEFSQIMESMAGNIYANMNQREEDISRTFENSLGFIENSKNNTKENVKINVIAGKGKNKEKTYGIIDYDYTTTGVLALREVERTYRHKFSYSLGYLHTGFEFNDGNDSEEWVDTIQLGVHNKYNMNNWVLKNDLMARVSFHNVDRNIDWLEPNKRSEMNGTYETYSLTSNNRLGREFNLGKKSSVVPYAGLRAMYAIRPTFKESGLEALEVEGNDAWSVKPRVGVELQTALPIGNTAWQIKGTVDLAYEYELANLNEREKAKLTAVEDEYHKLSKPEDEKGTFRTKASVGVEVESRYGIFVTGEYLTGKDKEDDYRVGVTLKAVF